MARGKWTAMLNYRNTPRVSLDDYAGVAPDDQLERAASLGTRLKGARVLHVNSTAAGGGVAEILRTLVGLMEGVGLDTAWYVLPPNDSFFQVTKRIHNHLQGMPGDLDDQAWETYQRYIHSRAREVVQAVNGSADAWVMHDPQVLPLSSLLPETTPRVWVCHVDTSSPNPRVTERLLPWIQGYSRVVFSSSDYFLRGLAPSQTVAIRPAIDPLTPKNRGLLPREAKAVLERLGMDTSRPIMTQVSRFDRWKDPLGVIQAYRLVKKEVPGVQLALVGVIVAMDDPEALEVLAEVRQAAGDDQDIHLFSDPSQVGDREVAAFQQASDVVLQKSIREGFGLTVAEAHWKGRAVVGGNCGGIRLQVQNGVNGYLVDSVEECAERSLELLRNPVAAREMGQRGREMVRQRYLIPRLLVDYLELLGELVEAGPSRNGASAKASGAM